MSATAFLDACGFIPVSTGTGDFVVSVAITGYQTPASAGAVNAVVYSYRAESADKTQWEEGFGAYTVSGTTLARTTITANSSGGTSKIAFSAAPNVYITAATADLQNASLLTGGTLPIGRLNLTPLTNSLGADVALNASTYTDGPSIAQGTAGTWFVTGTVSVADTGGNNSTILKLWDGTTVIASTKEFELTANAIYSLSLSGVITNPAANLRISGLGTSATTSFKFNASGNSKDCTINAFRIG